MPCDDLAFRGIHIVELRRISLIQRGPVTGRIGVLGESPSFVTRNDFIIGDNLQVDGVNLSRIDRVIAHRVTTTDEVKVEIIVSFHFIKLFLTPYMVDAGFFRNNLQVVTTDIIRNQFVLLVAQARVGIAIAGG